MLLIYYVVTRLDISPDRVLGSVSDRATCLGKFEAFNVPRLLAALNLLQVLNLVKLVLFG